MPSSLPGMDPYLEHPQSWPNFHHRLITAIAIDLAPQLRPKYWVVVEEALYQTKGQDSLLVGIPDVAVHKSARSAASLSSQTVAEVPIAQPLEVELPMAEVIRQGYLEIRGVSRPRASLYAFNLADAIPAFPLPLAMGDVEPIVNLQKLVGEIYDQSGYDLVINYQENPVLPLTDDDITWLNEWLQQQGVR